MTCSKQVSMEERVERPRGDINLIDASLGRNIGKWEQVEVYTSFCPEDKFGFAVFQSEYLVKGHIVRTAGTESAMKSSLWKWGLRAVNLCWLQRRGWEKMFTPVKFDWGEPVSPCQLSKMSVMFMLHYRRSNWEVLRENYFKSRYRQREWNTIEWHGEKGKMITPVKLGSLWTLANNRRWAWCV